MKHSVLRVAAIGLLSGATVCAFAQPRLERLAVIDLPGVHGRIDHLAADVGRHRIFVAALGNDTVEVLDTSRNRRETSISGFGEPQGVGYAAEAGRIYVANGSAESVDVLDAASLARLKRIASLDDADNVRYDAATGMFMVGYGKGALRLLDAATGESRGEIALPGHPESFQLERAGNRVFVNVPTAGEVAVVDRRKLAVTAAWRVPARANFPMALDEAGKRLFVGTRSPAAVFVYDTDSGAVVARMAIGGDTDDLFFDVERQRLYVICGAGRVDVFRRASPDRFVTEGFIKTAPRARTGLFVPEEGRLYVAAPANGRTPARVLVFGARGR